MKFELFLLHELLNRLAVSRNPKGLFCTLLFLLFPTLMYLVILSMPFKNIVSFYSDYIEMCLIGPLSFRESEQMEKGKLITKFPNLIDWAHHKEY